MKAKWLHIFVTLAVVVTGCASQRVAYTKPGVTEAERRRDETACLQRSLGGHPERVHILAPVVIDREVFTSCLESRGYSASTP